MSNPTQHEAAERVSDERLRHIAVIPRSADLGDVSSIAGELLAIRAHDAGQAGVVTDEMVDRARVAAQRTDGYTAFGWRVTKEAMRAALIAALKDQPHD